ncbi:hypothetical protein KDX01_13560 [Burkholderia vietnamiensis]|uniref:hypothetical protein n=1 Tax=Burkholderia vietnamiensis TaxID=60552 RepID=UPI001B9771D3|nr:hypothetical protein [Burkholderia vietnamiensis]MBR7974120.1 hypothetical protein [Burkholderia vietnamiensis]
MTRSNSLDTDSQGQDRGDSTPGPEGKRHGTHTPPPRSAHDPAEGKPLSSDEGAPADPRSDGAAAHMPTRDGDTR